MSILKTAKGSKLTKKKVFVIGLALCILATLSMGTLAWFTAQDSVTNDFYVADTDADPDEVFGIEVKEIVDGEEMDEEGHEYESILPGDELSKELYLTNTGVHAQYVRAIVTVSSADILKDAMEDWTDAGAFLQDINENWTLDAILYTEEEELVYIFYYNVELAAGETTEAIFESVVIPTALTLDQAMEMESFSITILGQAIQVENLGVSSAKAAFEQYWDEADTIAGYAQEDILEQA